MLSFGESVGDHRTMIFDVSTRSLIGKFEHRIVRAGCRRLNCKTHSLHSYNSILESLMARHRMEPRLDAIIEKIVDDTPTKAQQAQMDALDKQMVELQKFAEPLLGCRRLSSLLSRPDEAPYDAWPLATPRLSYNYRDCVSCNSGVDTLP